MMNLKRTNYRITIVFLGAFILVTSWHLGNVTPKQQRDNVGGFVAQNVFQKPPDDRLHFVQSDVTSAVFTEKEIPQNDVTTFPSAMTENEKHLPPKQPIREKDGLSKNDDVTKFPPVMETTNKHVTAREPMREKNVISKNDDAYAEQRARHERIRRVCVQRGKEYNNSFHDMLSIRGKVFGFHEDIYICRAFKSATTFSIGLLSQLFNCTFECYYNYAKDFASLEPHGKKEVLRNSFSFFFVREPYQRLFSVYSNKFYLPKEFWMPVGGEIALEYRKKPSDTSLRYGHDVIFRELIQYVIDAYENDETPDKHVIPDYKLCNPCNYNYTFIGKLETFNSDWKYLIDTWTKKNYTRPLADEDMDALMAPNIMAPIRHMYETKSILRDSGVPVINLFRRTWSYYQIIGQISKNIDMPLTEEEIDKVKPDVFEAAIKKGIEDSKQFGSAVKEQKREALFQAYASVPNHLLERLRKALSMDCELFGYDDRPAWIFERDELIVDHDYFKYLD